MNSGKNIRLIVLGLAVAFLICSGPAIGADEWDGYGRFAVLSLNESNMVLVGEVFQVQVKAAEFGHRPKVRVIGDAIELLGSKKGSGMGLRFGFKALEKGKAVIEITGAGKKAEYPVLSVTPEEIPAAKISDLMKNPEGYKFRLFRLDGKNRGWAPPVKVKEAWGERLTKSDWVLEDDTGAVNVTGQILQREPELTVIAYLAPMGDSWTVWAVYIAEHSSAPSSSEMKADLELKKDTENIMKIGQVGKIGVYPDRSTVFDFEIDGDAVIKAGLNRDELYLSAIKEGEATVNIFLRRWQELDLPEEIVPPERTPAAVYKIKVVK